MGIEQLDRIEPADLEIERFQLGRARGDGATAHAVGGGFPEVGIGLADGQADLPMAESARDAADGAVRTHERGDAVERVVVGRRPFAEVDHDRTIVVVLVEGKAQHLAHPR
jgi:hypothetical protein